MEVVRLHEEREPLLAVSEVVEHRARKELVPERLPEPLDLAERHRMLRLALEMHDPVLPQCLLELGLASPRRVLPTIVRQDLLRRPVLRDPSLERFHHQAALLMVSDDVRHHEARVIVHEADEVDALMLAQQEREDVRLPHLVRPRAFEASRWLLLSLA